MDFSKRSSDNQVVRMYNDETTKVDAYKNNEDAEERGNWTGRFDFILSCIGYAVGLGNVWRFPYLCYKNGGGAFFIPYFVFLIFVGMPIFLFELGIGQFTSQGPLTCWNNAKFFTGIGLAMAFVSALVGIYYNVIIAWAIWYLCASFTSRLPWTDCNITSSFTPTNLCWQNYRTVTIHECNLTNGVARKDGACYVNNTLYAIYNETLGKSNGLQKRTAAADYLNEVGFRLRDANGLENLGPLRWDMSLALLLAWIIVLLCLVKGIKSSGKVVYFTALFPYVVLIILFIRGMMTEGMEEGIRFYISPNITKLTESEVWKDAASQIFFSLSASFGGLITLSSYNKFHNNLLRDTFIVCIGNSLTSIFAGFVIFSYLGALAKQLNVNVSDVADSGPSLAFTIYPQAVTFLPFPPIWSILFFIMLITLGLDSEFALLETVVTCISDTLTVSGKMKINQKRKTILITVVCIIGFFLSLIMATCGGPYLLTLMDDYSGGWNVLLIAFFECVCIAWVYGGKRFCEDLRIMLLGDSCFCDAYWRVFRWWFIVMWYVVTPGLVMFIMVFSLVKYSPSKYSTYIFPVWANALGWCMTIFVISGLFIPIFVVFYQEDGTIGQRFLKLMQPNIFWGPALIENRKEVQKAYDSQMILDPWSNTNSNIDTVGKSNNAYQMDELGDYKSQQF